jgi:hypothetical protein
MQAQTELTKLPTPTADELIKLNALQGSLSLAMVRLKGQEHPSETLVNQVQTALTTTTAILGANQAIQEATKSQQEASVPAVAQYMPPVANENRQAARF